jgi:Acetyltransferase (GNAT) domain
MTWSVLPTVPDTVASSSLFDSVGWLRAWETVAVERRDRHAYVTTGNGEVLPLYRASHSPFWHGYEIQCGVAPLSDQPIVFAGSTYSMYSKRGTAPAGLVRGAYETAFGWTGPGGLLVAPNLTDEGVASWEREVGPAVGKVLLDRTYHCDLATSFPDYLGRLPNKLRRDVQRRLRRSEERGLRFSIVDGADAVAMVRDTLPLTVGTTDEHDWPPLYDEPALTTLLGVPGAVLATAQVNGELVGVFFGFVHGDEATFLCGGVEYSRLTELSTYVALMYGCTEWACRRGLKRVEWGRDNYRFKERHGLDGTDLWALVYSQRPDPGLAGRLTRMNDVLTAYIERD